MDCSTPGFPVHHQLPEPNQTHVYWVGEAFQPSHPLVAPLSSRLQSFPVPIDPKQSCGCLSVGLKVLLILPLNFPVLFLGTVSSSGVSACLDFLFSGGRRASWEVSLSWGSGASALDKLVRLPDMCFEGERKVVGKGQKLPGRKESEHVECDLEESLSHQG